MKRSIFSITASCFLLPFFFLGKSDAPGASAKVPNIILIMADDLGVETLGVYGGESYQTPNLDELARKGMRFTHCYSTPLCTPSRVQLMTGKYNFRNYVGFGLLDAGEKTFAHYLKEKGYHTLVAGKWQLWGNEVQQKLAGGRVGSTPGQAGFDDYCLWQVKERGYRYKNPYLTLAHARLPDTQSGTQEFPGGYGPDIFVDYMEAFTEEHHKEPLFVYYPMVLTHDPFVPTPKNPDFANFESGAKVNDTTYFREMVGYMDALVGRIIRKTEELGLSENTLVLFVGDNGTDRDVTSIRNGVPVTGDKGNTTQGGTHVPLIAYWKGKIQAGAINENLIDFTDFLPTLLEAATGTPLQSPDTDGLSFYPQLVGREAKVRDWVFCDYAPNWGKFESRRYVQDQRWKLYGNGEFYDFGDDPLEQQPLDTLKLTATLDRTLKKFRTVLKNYSR